MAPSICRVLLVTFVATYVVSSVFFVLLFKHFLWDVVAAQQASVHVGGVSYHSDQFEAVGPIRVPASRTNKPRKGRAAKLAWNESSAEFLPHLPPYSDKTFVYTVLTTQNYHGTRLKNIMETWGQHVNMPFITTDALDPKYPNALVLGAQGGDLGGKTLQALKKFCEYDGDFFVFTDDDSFIVAGNLESVIAANYDRDEPLYAGYSLTHTPKPFIGGGGGIVFSNQTMQRFCATATSPTPMAECSWEKQRSAPGDIAISHCMNRLNVPATHQHGFYSADALSLVERGWCGDTLCPRWVPVSRLISCQLPSSAAMLRTLYFLTYIFDHFGPTKAR